MTTHIWILLLNSLQFLYIDFYNGEIGCPTPKRFNSPSIVERRAPGAPQNNPLDIKNSLGYPPRGSPAAAAERVY